jgi:hypothetical protein
MHIAFFTERNVKNKKIYLNYKNLSKLIIHNIDMNVDNYELSYNTDVTYIMDEEFYNPEIKIKKNNISNNNCKILLLCTFAFFIIIILFVSFIVIICLL